MKLFKFVKNLMPCEILLCCDVSLEDIESRWLCLMTTKKLNIKPGKVIYISTTINNTKSKDTLCQILSQTTLLFTL